MRVGLDAMGGDLGPDVIIQGGLEGIAECLDADDRLVLYGNEDDLRQRVAALGAADHAQVEYAHCSEVIGMDDSPVEAVREKRDSTIVNIARDAGKGKVDAIISAGNTGAFAAASQLRIKTLPGVGRPGIGVAIPTFHGPVLLIDAGANIAPKPRHLYEYAHMGMCYARHILKKERTRVGLISIGEEEVKGNQLTKEARALLRSDATIDYVGSIEGRDIFDGVCEIVVCDGFVGNVVLKLTEGLSEGIFRTIRRELAAEGEELSTRFEPVVQRIWTQHDFREYGGAPLLGLNSIVIICHGRSDAHAIRSAVGVAKQQADSRILDTIRQTMAAHTEEAA
jgi:glycerol-3-phosphate acyltransferase PlsX